MRGKYAGALDPSLSDAAGAVLPERIAALNPDLILADGWSVDEGLYAQLTQVAPTYVGLNRNDNTPWQGKLSALTTLTGADPETAARRMIVTRSCSEHGLDASPAT